MSQRSPYNDRYKTDSKGKTRKSAAGAKPKREAGVPASTAPSAKKKTPAKKRWGVGPASGPVAPPAQTPEMQKLRRIWWVLWAASLLIAVVILLLQQGARSNPALAQFVPVMWGLWAAALGGAFYLEFGPLRKARMAAIQEAKHAKGKKGAKRAATTPAPAAPASKPSALSALGAMFGRSKPDEGVHEVPAEDAGAAGEPGADTSDEDGDA